MKSGLQWKAMGRKPDKPLERKRTQLNSCSPILQHHLSFPDSTVGASATAEPFCSTYQVQVASPHPHT